MEAKEIRRKGMGKHALIMLLCCLVPLVIFLVLWKLGIGGNYLFIGLLLLCPILHLVMMRGMGKDGENHGGHVQ